MVHYYTDNKDLQSQPRQISVNYKDKQYTFISDLGVFSKDSIDYGSRVLLDTFDSLEDISLLDVGCGYGTIGLLLAANGKNVICDMVDVNTRAIDLAKQNATRFDVEANIFESSCYEHVDKQYDLVVSNPPIRAGKAVVHEILGGSFDHLKSGGELRVVIQKKQGAPSAKKKMEEVFGNCDIIKKDKGYYILRSIKDKKAG